MNTVISKVSITKASNKSRLLVAFALMIVMVVTSVTPAFAFAPYGTGEYEHNGGWLTITNQNAITNAPIHNSIFVVSRQYDGEIISIFAADEHGRTEAITLPVGEFYLSQQKVQQGYIPIPQIPFVVVEGMRMEKTVFNHPVETTPPIPPTPTTPMLNITNNPITAIPFGQTPSGRRDAGAEITIVPGYAEGWQFVGWSIDGIMRHSDFISLFFTMPNVDITVTAYWEANGQPQPTPSPEPTPQPTPEPMGRVLITNQAQGTNQILVGAVFEVRRLMDDSLVATLVTDNFGEAALDLPVGDYFIRQVVVPAGFVLNPARIPLRITQNTVTPINVTNTPIPTTTPDPPTQDQPPAHGRLIVTSRAQGTGTGANANTGALLQGATFEIRRVMDDVFVAQITTNQFGEASVNLPSGDYFKREIVAPHGFIPNPSRVSVRIQTDRLTEINVTHRPIELAAEPPSSTTPSTSEVAADGRLLITNRAQVSVAGAAGSRTQGAAASGTNLGEPIIGAIFEVRSIMDDGLVAQLQTNQFGEAAVNLPAGDYFIRQIVPSAGFVLDTSRTNIRIVSGELLAVTVVSAAYDAGAIGENENAGGDNETAANGRLLVTLMSSATGERLSNATITIHDVMTDALITTLTTDFFGEASVFLPVGRYFMRQSTMPQGYLANLDRIPFTINAGDITDMALAIRAVPAPIPEPTPSPSAAQGVQGGQPSQTTLSVNIETTPNNGANTQGRIEIITRAAGSGNPLSGGVFAIYRAYDNRRVGELTTGANGRAYFMVESGMYFIRQLRPTFGFLLEHQRIFLEVGDGETVTMELTKERDYSIAYLPTDTDGGGIIYIPPTGQDMSVFHYVGGGALLLVALATGFVLFKTNRNERMRLKWQG